MALSTRVSLLFLSLFCAISICTAQESISEDNYLLTRRYAYELSMDKGHITGIMITKDEGNNIVGTLVNEFGVSALSFVYDKKKNKMKLQDVMSMLNKWYIKRTLKNDLTYCIQILFDLPHKNNTGYDVSSSLSELSVANNKRKLIYNFKPLSLEIENDSEQQPI